MTERERDIDAATCAKMQLMLDFGDVLTEAMLERIAYSAVAGARETIEDEQRVKDAEIAIGGSTTVPSSGMTVIVGNWRRAEYGHVAAEEILKASPSYVDLPSVPEVTPEPQAPRVTRISDRRVRAEQGARLKPEGINPVSNGFIVSEAEILGGFVPPPHSIKQVPVNERALVVVPDAAPATVSGDSSMPWYEDVAFGERTGS